MEVQEMLKIEAAYSEKGDFIGLRLVALCEKDPKINTLLMFSDQSSMIGFRVNSHFTPALNKTIKYKELRLASI